MSNYEYDLPVDQEADFRYRRDQEAEWFEARTERARDEREHRADWKMSPRIIEDQVGWEVLRRAKLGPCRVCGDSWLPQLHHLVAVGRTSDGDDVADNLVPLCKTHHQEFHSARPGIAEAIRSSLTQAEVRYVTAKKGAEFLERRYPRGLEAA